MYSRACVLRQFKSLRTLNTFGNSIQFNIAEFSSTEWTKARHNEVYKIPERKTNNIVHSALNKFTQYFSGNKIGSISVTGLVLNLDKEVPPIIEDKTIIANATDQTVAQIIDTQLHQTSELVETVSEQNVNPLQNSESSLTNVVDETSTLASDSILLGESIPQPPPIPDVPLDAVVEQLNILGQPTFASLGLGGWSPVGLIQTTFEYFNVTLGVPWWETIIIGTLVIRLCMFPLVVIAQRNAAKMNNNLPQLQAIQLKLTDARQSGNQLEAARYSQEMMLFMKEKELNPLKNMIVPLAQMPVFISFFVSLRQMSNLPVESLKSGGLWWFADLTLPDQYFIMPVVTSLTLWATIELGTDTAKLSSQNLQTMKYVLRALPLCILPFTVNFPGAILLYWTSSNFVSLAQVGVLKIPAVREYFKIDKQVRIDPTSLPVKPKGFTEGIKDSWTNMKIVRELEERRRLDEIQFKRAGNGPIVKTYKHDPTKQIHSSSATPISAKKR